MSGVRSHLLAVDVGLHTGLAFFDDNGRLLWYRSHHLSAPAKLKKMAGTLLRLPPEPTHIYLEGGGPLADIWLREAGKLALPVYRVTAEQWRTRFFHARQHKNGGMAKKQAEGLARIVIRRLGGRNPTRLRHDTAEAILIGYYGLQELGWLDKGNLHLPGKRV